MAASKTPLAEAAPPGTDLNRIAQEMYQKNLALAESNKTLSLLRKIDEIVLSPSTDINAVMQNMTDLLIRESGFPFSVIYLKNDSKGLLEFQSMACGVGSVEAAVRLKELMSHKPISLRQGGNPAVRSVKSLVIVSTEQLFDVLRPSLPIEESEDMQVDLELASFYICPLQLRGEVLGAMVLGSTRSPSELSFYEKNVLERLTLAVGIAIDNKLLYNEAKETAARLKIANRNLKELDQAKDEFISIASHQLRTPLTSIKGYLSMLLEGDAGKVSAKQKEYLGYAFDGSQRMVGLISDLLNVSRMSAGKFFIEKKSTDLVKMVEEEVQQLQPHAQAKRLKLEFRHPGEPLPPLEVDENKTRQVVMNFIDNAIYYTKKGSVVVTLKRTKTAVELRVTDTGIGVPSADKQRLFTKFYRAGNALQIRPDGTGLGLFLAKRVINDQGGTILFESTENKGSTFGFSIPLKGK